MLDKIKMMQKGDKKFKIMMTGGGSGGPVTPLLAVVDYLNEQYKNEFNFVWIGTKKGPEKEMVEFKKINFLVITSGKFRRYFSWQNLVDIFKIFFGFLESLILVKKEKPDLVMSAGGFVSVPVAYAAKLMGVPVLIHQQDVVFGLANKLMSLVAVKITTTFNESSMRRNNKFIWTGNPVSEEVKRVRQKDYEYFGLNDVLPVILVLGGGTGAMNINKLIQKTINDIGAVAQIFHQTGQGKSLKIAHQNYKSKEFLNAREIAKLLFLADVVVSRCGMGFLTELVYLKKASILIPMPDSHQEYNAEIFKNHQAAVVLSEKNLDEEKFISEIKKMLANNEKRELLQRNIHKVIKQDAEEKITKEIFKILKK
jgi:UDP-N-acetylglucosamine--N-acetylmuramyl-(pentapeptide) pyrophosphoryl-undecaprenol N-acetylglucosamine transferase